MQMQPWSLLQHFSCRCVCRPLHGYFTCVVVFHVCLHGNALVLHVLHCVAIARMIFLHCVVPHCVATGPETHFCTYCVYCLECRSLVLTLALLPKKHGSLWRAPAWGSTRTKNNSMWQSQWTARRRSTLRAEEPSRTIVQQRSSSRLHVFRKKYYLYWKL